jgi:cytochrome c oxidase cbb3-type subunit III
VIMSRRIIASTLAICVAVVCVACSNSSGRPAQNSAVISPAEIVDFGLLYGQNCAGCHGVDGKGGAAIALANPVFLAIADDTVIRRIASNGVPGTPMSAFAQSAGGMLTETQIDALVRGIRSWAKPDALGGQTPPPYAAAAPGDPQRGAAAYRIYCSACHGADGRGGSKASSIVNGSYLALVSDGELRTIVIAGRPDLGSPDWRGDVEGRPMSTQEVSDVVAWLASQRPKFPGQPYSTAAMKRGGPQ